MILYPNKYLLSGTLKCMLAAHIYKLPVELSDDFFFTRTFEVEKSLVVNKRPLLIYENKFVSSTNAICFLLHRLRNKGINAKSLDDKLRLYLTWIEWSDILEKNIERLNKKKIIESLDLLESYLSENNNKEFICDEAEQIKREDGCDETDQNQQNDTCGITLADIYVYTSLKYSNIVICNESWSHINSYVERINNLEDVQKVIETVEKVHKLKNIYSLFISKICEKNINDHVKNENFYITTAINYVNGDPHIGHAYEIVLADTIARYHRNLGRDLFFTTGADEHGLKIANQAARNNMTPQELCDQNVIKFKKLNKDLYTTEDYYVRTTAEIHKNIAQSIWTKCMENGDIYLGEYEGWYNVREETYIPENEAKLMNYMDPLNNVKLEKMKEPSYFFRMSKYQDRLLQHIHDNPDFIQPEKNRNEILQRLKEPLEDLSCSRTKFSWGIPVPNDPKHVMYVWMDALINYYSNCFINDQERVKYWPADIHIIGKDIVWFHAVIFPTILMSINIELPKCIFSHGFVLAGDGKKMSKSLKNVIDPKEIIEAYGPDAFRFHVVKESKRGYDMRFDVDNLVDMCNSDLADTIGNLVQRTLSLCFLSNNAKIPPLYDDIDVELPFCMLHFINRIEYYMKNFHVHKFCEKTVNVCKDLNKFLTDLAPWKYKQESEQNKKLHIIRLMLESIYFIAHYIDMVVPMIASQIFSQLNTPKKKIVDLNPWLNNLQEGVTINNDHVLFKKFEVESVKIKIQKVIMKLSKVIKVIEHGELKNSTLYEIETDDGKYIALLNLPHNESHINTLTVAIMNIKPLTINNITVTSIIPHVHKEIFKFSPDENMPVGTLVHAKNYKTLVKQRDNLTKKEINSLQLSIINNNCFYEKNVPLVFASSDNPLYHATQTSGTLNFFS
ncbi:methionyl-tRNA synthetase [Plasmodium vinckei petteri]|uniref:methionine--tRNA ligase n=1 Tax=Plasmodium vinckei petteri TaxID=138298 RepID=W7ASK1_PLAVN|nr:methionyl-tRNA synthetase [Plasmodium vinckei petteri]CAD2099238.1 methionine--tRNA ligase, putative [Plasmodium vinckei petteri]